VDEYSKRSYPRGRKPLRKVSPKQSKENAECQKIVNQLRDLCGDKSELQGVMTYKRNSHNTEPHHLKGRHGKHLINPFEILMCYANQHDYRQKHLKETRETDLQLVREIRLRQGFKEADYE
jgi:hypothetical protein